MKVIVLCGIASVCWGTIAVLDVAGWPIHWSISGIAFTLLSVGFGLVAYLEYAEGDHA